jgi:hypothetical protein
MLISRANASGEEPVGLRPNRSRPALTSPVFSASRTAVLRLSTPSADVFAEPKMAAPIDQFECGISGLSHRRNVGKQRAALRGGDDEPVQLPGLLIRNRAADWKDG